MAKKLTTEGSLTEQLTNARRRHSRYFKKITQKFISKSIAIILKNKRQQKSCVSYNTTWSYGKCCGGRRHGQSRCTNGQTYPNGNNATMDAPNWFDNVEYDRNYNGDIAKAMAVSNKRRNGYV